MGLVFSSKTIGDVTEINCDGTLDVTLAISAAPDIINNPADIILVLDHSRSMAGQPLIDLKVAAKVFVDIISDATGAHQMIYWAAPILPWWVLRGQLV